jgi:hypothetical protein
VIRWRSYLLRGLAELAGVLFCVLALLLAWQVFAVGVNGGPADSLALGVGGLLTFLALLAVHELGHLLAGRAVGLPFERFTVGPLQLVREGGRWRARLNTAWSQPAAYVLLPPPQVGHGYRRWRWAAMVLGGPLANLLVGAACLAAAGHLNPCPPASVSTNARAGWRGVAILYPGDLTTAWLNMAGIVSLWLGVCNLVPGSAKGMRSDGGQLLDLWRAAPKV